MISNVNFAEQAKNGNYIGIPYSRLDCQEFVEKVLSDCGIRRNWRGSNDMWRNAVHDQRENDRRPPVGAWVFTIKYDGKEDKSRYTDGINAAHVGIYVGDGICIHSTTGGVQWSNIDEKRWTHYALANEIDYNGNGLTDHEMLLAIYNKIMEV